MKYEPIFKLPYSNVFITELFMPAYSAFSPIVTIKNGAWEFYLPEDALRETAKRGYEIALREKAYESYSKKYESFFASTAELKSKSITHISKEKFLEFLTEFRKLALNFLKAYNETEFFYFARIEKEISDYIEDKFSFEEVLSGEADIASWPENMRKLADYIINMQHIKLEYRKLMNSLALGQDSLLSGILQQLQARTSRKDAVSMTFEEILKLFAGENLKDSFERHVYSFITWDAENNKLKIISGGEAYRKIRELDNYIPKNEVIGTPACKGIIRGKARIIPFSMNPEEYLHKMQDGEILISDTTGPEMMIVIEKAAGIVTDEGGMMSHAAVVSREFSIPCVVGTIYATKTFKDGDMIEVNANNGIVKKI